MKHPYINFFLSCSPIIVGIIVRLYMIYGASDDFAKFIDYNFSSPWFSFPDLSFFCINLFLLSILTIDSIMKENHIFPLFKTIEQTKIKLKYLNIFSYICFIIILIILFAFNIIGEKNTNRTFHYIIITILIVLALGIYISTNIIYNKNNN